MKKIIVFVLLQIIFVVSMTQARESVLRRGDVHIGASQEVEDIVCAHGNVTIEGHVLGSIFVVSGDVLMKSTAIVDNNVTLTNGNIWVAKGAVIKKSLNTFGGKIHLEEGTRVLGGVQEAASPENLSGEILSLMEKYIVMDRPIPPQTFNLAGLSSLNLEQYGFGKRLEREINRFDISGIGEVRFSPRVVEDARELYYHRGVAEVVLRVIKFNSQEDADNFWEILRELPESKMSKSVHVSLGDGAHWFFRHKNFTTCMWYRGKWFTYLDVSVNIPVLRRIERFWKEPEELRDSILMDIEGLYQKADQEKKKK